jgi:tetratricopeptide (TPR) repeat protein
MFFLFITFILQIGAFDSEQILSLIQARELAQAESRLKSTASANRSNPQWHYLYGRLEFRRDKPADALPHFEKAADLDKRSAVYSLWVGNSACQAAGSASVLRQPFLARTCKAAYDKTLELDPKNVDARSSLIRYHMQAPGIVGGDEKLADKYATELMTLAPFTGLSDRYWIAMYRKQRDVSLNILGEGVTTFPDSTYFRYQLGLRLIEDQAWAASMAQFRELAKLQPDAWTVRYQIVRLAALSGEYMTEGRKEAEQLLSQDREDMSVGFKSMLHTRYGQILARQGDAAGARKAFDEALRINPDNEVAPAERAKLRH